MDEITFKQFVKENRPRVEVEERTEEVQVLGPDGKPTGETKQVKALWGEIYLDELLHCRSVILPPALMYPEMYKGLRKILVESLLRQAYDAKFSEGYAYCPNCDAMNAVFTPFDSDVDLRCLKCGFAERESDLEIQ